MLAMTCRFWLQDKSPRVVSFGAHPGETGCATAHLLTVFDRLYSKLDREYGAKFAPPEQRRNLAIRWVETDELLLEINAIDTNIRDKGRSASGKESSAG